MATNTGQEHAIDTMLLEERTLSTARGLLCAGEREA